jgi:hypothetical protein
MPECGYCSKEFAADESYCHTLAAAMDCPKVDLVQRAVLTAVAESIEKGATVDLGDGQFQKVPGAEDAAIAHHRAELYRSQSELLDQLVKAHQTGDAAEVDVLLDRLTVAHMAVTFEELIDYRRPNRRHCRRKETFRRLAQRRIFFLRFSPTACALE